jgi:hypothetical protein
MNRQVLRRVGFVVAICAAAGALAGIAGSMAAPSKSSSSSSSVAKRAQLWRMRARMHARRFGRFGGLGPGPAMALGAGGPPVHAQAVVPNANGDGFDTITFDVGTLKSIDGTKLTLTEGTDKATYGTPTIDVGSDAKVFRNHEKASLSDLKEGDLVRIVQAPKGTLVWAEDPAFQKQERQNRPHWGPPGGPGFAPGAPAPGAYPGGYGSSGSSGSNS